MGALSVLNNISSMEAQNSLAMTQSGLNSTLEALSTGQRINSGADDPAGLAIANGLRANVSALTQSVQNATAGVGMLQVADGALSQVSTLLNTAISIATESSTGTVSNSQRTALQAQFASIQAEITSIGTNTTYNGQAIFGASASLQVYMSDSTTVGSLSVSVTMGQVDDAHLNGSSLASDNLSTATAAQAALTDINAAIANIAGLRGNLGAASNQLTAATNVMNSQVTNLQSAESGIMDANIGTETANMSKYSILQQTGIAALQQSNQAQQAVLKLLQ
jgi:flagellin